MFCDVCSRQTSFGRVMRERVVQIHGKKITVSYQAKICARCKAEQYDEKLEIDIMQRAKTLYRSRFKAPSFYQNGSSSQEKPAMTTRSTARKPERVG